MGTRIIFRRAMTLVLGALAASLSPPASAQAPPEPAVSEELIVVESSILLQRSERTRLDGLEVSVDGSVAELIALYPLREIGFPSTLYFDLCPRSFSRLTHAVGMAVAVSEQLVANGPVSVVTGGPESRVLLAASDDVFDLEAALTVVLQSPRGGCGDQTPLAAMGRLRQALAALDGESTAPKLLIAYGFDHSALGGDDLRRFEAEFGQAGRVLAGEGRTTVVLMPHVGDAELKEEEVRPLLGDPEGPPRTIDLGAVLAYLISPKQVVPDDPRILDLAIDPRNELLRELIAPGQGRLFAYPRQLEAFVRKVRDYQVLYYRSRLRQAGRAGELAPIEVRTRSGDRVPTAVVISRGPAAPAAE